MGHPLTTEELIRRCSSADGTRADWEEFVRRFQPAIVQTVLRTSSRLGDSSSATVTDLVQETYLKLCADNFRLLRTFHPSHPDAFAGFVRTVAANLVRDHFRAQHSQRRGNSQTHSSEFTELVPDSPTSAGNRDALQRSILLSEIDKHLRAALDGADAARNHRVFWLYFRAGCSAAEIAVLPGIGLTAKGVESLLARLTRDLRRRVAAPLVIADTSNKEGKNSEPPL